MSYDLFPNQPEGHNAEETDKCGKDNQGSGHMSLDSEGSTSSEDDSDNEEQWPLPSWPVRLCAKCVAMTSTVEAPRALSTTSGYVHHEFEDLLQSAVKGCVLYHEILDHLTGCDYAQNDQLSHTWWKNTFKEEFVSAVSIRGSFTLVPSPEEEHSQNPGLELRNFDIGRMSRNGVRHTSPLFEPYGSRTRNKFDIFTDAQSPKWLHPNIVASKETFEVS